DRVNKGDTLDVQSDNAKAGLEANDKSTSNSNTKDSSGGNATSGNDAAGGKAKAKKDFPEAPDPAIGMQDERGGKGG
ncbi:hypothetical protein K504DRAFT_360967, partial [Pleomassaria siparia CBS 279.74]